MITLQKTDYQQMEQAAADAGVTLPIEQTDVWARFQADIPGRTPWGVYMNQRDGETVAFSSAGQQFVWTFDGLDNRPVDLAKIAPSGFAAKPLTVYVGKNPMNRR